MTKQELIKKVAEASEMTQTQVDAVLKAFVSVVKEDFSNSGIDESVSLAGFGKFVVKERAERQYRNPATGETAIAPAKRVVKFKAAKDLLESVKQYYYKYKYLCMGIYFQNICPFLNITMHVLYVYIKQIKQYL